MEYYFIEPEVAGGFGSETVTDKSSGIMKVTKLHYQFDGWHGDELLESTPCFIVTSKLASKIQVEKLSGVKFNEVYVTKSDEFEDFFPDVQLPEFVWLQVDGVPGVDDFGITSDLNLIVSEYSLKILKESGISHAASITKWDNSK